MHLGGIHSLVSPACESGCRMSSRLTEVAVNVSGRLQIERARFGDGYETFCEGKQRFLPVLMYVCAEYVCFLHLKAVCLLRFNSVELPISIVFLHFLNN